MSKEVARRIRATVRVEVEFDVPDDWTQGRFDEATQERHSTDLAEMLETLSSRAIQGWGGDVLDSEVDSWEALWR